MADDRQYMALVGIQIYVMIIGFISILSCERIPNGCIRIIRGHCSYTPFLYFFEIIKHK